MSKISRALISGTSKRIEVIETAGKQYYSDLHPDMQIEFTTNDVMKVVNVKAVQSALVGIISTRKGERPFDPLFGSDIHSSLFENMDEFAAFAVEKAVAEAINNYEPRVQLREVRVLPMYDENAFYVSVKYHLITDLNYIYNLKLRLRDEI